MMYINRDAAVLCAPHIEGGVCVDHPLVLPRLNEAQRRLIKTDDFNFTLDQLRIYTKGNSIALSREYIAARLITMDDYPIPIDSQAYEYIASGPGKCIWDQMAKLVDEGKGHPTFFEISQDPATDWYLVAFSTDTQLSLTYRARANDGTEVMTGTSPFNTLGINAWKSEGMVENVGLQISAVPVRKVTGISLPDDRTAYVSLYAYDPTTHNMHVLSRYAPSEKTPGYRRYRLPRWDSTDGIRLDILCKKQHIDAVSLEETLLIQDIDAIKHEIIAIERGNVLDVNGSVAYSQLAQRQLQQTQSNENQGIRFNIVVMGDNVESSYIQ